MAFALPVYDNEWALETLAIQRNKIPKRTNSENTFISYAIFMCVFSSSSLVRWLVALSISLHPVTIEDISCGTNWISKINHRIQKTYINTHTRQMILVEHILARINCISQNEWENCRCRCQRLHRWRLNILEDVKATTLLCVMLQIRKRKCANELLCVLICFVSIH